jgi:chemotaxis protein CheD
MNVGLRNIAFARSYLEMEGFKLVTQDVGDRVPRRIVYFPATGRVMVKHLPMADCGAIATRESHYRAELRATSAGNGVELFD